MTKIWLHIRLCNMHEMHPTLGICNVGGVDYSGWVATKDSRILCQISKAPDGSRECCSGRIPMLVLSNPIPADHSMQCYKANAEDVP